jgi:hypothetical protein
MPSKGMLTVLELDNNRLTSVGCRQCSPCLFDFDFQRTEESVDNGRFLAQLLFVREVPERSGRILYPTVFERAVERWTQTITILLHFIGQISIRLATHLRVAWNIIYSAKVNDGIS